MSARWVLRFATALGILFTAFANAQTNSAALMSTGLAKRAVASIEVIDDSEIRLYDTISFYVRVSLDKSASSDINVSSVVATLQGPTSSIYAVSPESCQLTASSVSPGESAVIATCVIDRASPVVGESADWLVIRSKVDAFVTLTVRPAGDSPDSLRVTAPILLRPPMYAPYLGGCFGAFALAALAGLWRFRTSRRLLRARARLSSSAPFLQSGRKMLIEVGATLIDLFFFILSEWGFATITAFVFIVLGQGTSVAGAPIQLTVTNFWGGVTVGLLAFPLNKWLLEKLGLSVPKAVAV